MKLILPTYPPDFKWVNLFVRSVKKFCVDYDDVKIDFIVESENLALLRSNLAELITDNMKIKSVEDILRRNKYNSKEATFYKSGDRKYTYQSIKKILGVIDSDEEFNLVIDSDNIAIKQFEFKELFNNFDKIYYCDWVTSDLQNCVRNNSNLLIKTNIESWTFESSFWPYKKSIMLKTLENVESVNVIRKEELFNFLNCVPMFFEKCLYDYFTIKNNENFEMISQQDAIKIFKNTKVEKILHNREYTTEHIVLEIDESCAENYISFLNARNYKIARINYLTNEVIIDKIIKKSSCILLTLVGNESNYDYWNNKIC